MAVLERGSWPVRRIEGIVMAPVLRPDGSVLQTPGYDEQTRLVYVPGREYPAVPDRPTKDDALDAAARLIEVVKVVDLTEAAFTERELMLIKVRAVGKEREEMSRMAEIFRGRIIDVTDIPDRPDIELFGPVLQVIRVPDLDAGITEANNTRFGLSASLIGGTPDDYGRFWANIRAGIINWNGPTNGASSKAPFGGIGLSGNHRPAAYYAADYCAYPVASTEMDQPRATIGVGMRP
jgi:acyl-CoA reductase-like NAD-dependent aldehyde dehydrogenase